MDIQDKTGIAGAVGCFLGCIAADQGLVITAGVLCGISMILLAIASAKR